MEIKLLNKGYKKNEQIYHDFINNQIDFDASYFSNKVIELPEAPDFPIYINEHNPQKKLQKFKEAIFILKDYYIQMDRDIHFDGLFWHSLLLTKRDYIMNEYGDQIDSYKSFKNIVFKPFDWENYIYKSVLITEYVFDYLDDHEGDVEEYIELFVNNLDLFNYIIKYEIFRNREFIVKFFVAAEELGIMKLLKKRVPDMPKDERYGRLVFKELNNIYPVVMVPLLPIESLKTEIMNALSLYVDMNEYFSANKN